MKENKYDNDKFFEQYGKMTRSVYGLEGAGEWHALRSVLPEMCGKTLLDLGCGYGWHCKYAAGQGAKKVVGIDLSKKMIDRANEINSDPSIEYHVMAVEDFDFRNNRFDVVLSSLTFHYIESFEKVCVDVHSCLSQGGEFVFSVEHPVFTASGTQEWYRDKKGEILHWPVDNYFSEGSRRANFLGEEVIKYHKTLTTYINGLLKSGFEITNLIEPEPSQELLDTVEGMRHELRRPMMLIISARKK
jgi:ftsJ-like methyltransferase